MTSSLDFGVALALDLSACDVTPSCAFRNDVALNCWNVAACIVASVLPCDRLVVLYDMSCEILLLPVAMTVFALLWSAVSSGCVPSNESNVLVESGNAALVSGFRPSPLALLGTPTLLGTLRSSSVSQTGAACRTGE